MAFRPAQRDQGLRRDATWWRQIFDQDPSLRRKLGRQLCRYCRNESEGTLQSFGMRVVAGYSTKLTTRLTTRLTTKGGKGLFTREGTLIASLVVNFVAFY